jgi:hypothetical protein
MEIDRNGVLVAEVPPSGSRGARLVLAPAPGQPPLAIRRIVVRSGGRPRFGPFVAFFATLSAAAWVRRKHGAALSIACGLALSAFVALAMAPAPLWLGLPGAGSALRITLPAALLAASAAMGLRSERPRLYWAALGLAGAAVFGCWVRWYFLPSAGSWDTEYWKAWMARSVSAGVTQVYGNQDATPAGHFLAQLLGREDLFQVEYKGRRFAVDYPPLSMFLWRWSWWAVSALGPRLDRAEAENVAVKLPPVLGDLASVAVLLFLFPDRRSRGAALAALYWALPLSWLGSAVLGLQDSAYTPLAVLGLAAAGRGRSGAAGALIAIAALVKPQGLIVAPAAVLALVVARASLPRAVVSGLAVVALALVPFALAGTLEEVAVHALRIFSQGRLSGGYANPWWLVGHLANGGDFAARVEYAPVESVSFPARLIGTVLFAAAVLVVIHRLRAARGSGAACLGGGALVFTYAILALGVHENHPHSMFLAFLASGLFDRRLRVFAALLSATYVLNMVSLSSLGRFYGLRYLAIEPLAGWLSGVRMGPGFDLTLPLAALNTILFVWLITFLKDASSAEAEGGAGGRVIRST